MTYTEFAERHSTLVAHVAPTTLRKWKERDKVPDASVTKLLLRVTKSVTSPPKSVTKQDSVTNGSKSVTKSRDKQGKCDKVVVTNLESVTEDLPELTPEYCAKFGYVVGQPHDWETIKAIFEAARRVRAKRTNPTDLLTVVEPSAEPGHPEWDFMSDGYARGFPGDSVRMRAEYRTPAALRRVAERDGVDFKELLRSRGYETLDSTAETPKSPPQPHPKNPKCSCAKCKEWRDKHIFKGGSK